MLSLVAKNLYYESALGHFPGWTSHRTLRPFLPPWVSLAIAPK